MLFFFCILPLISTSCIPSVYFSFQFIFETLSRLRCQQHKSLYINLNICKSSSLLPEIVHDYHQPHQLGPFADIDSNRMCWFHILICPPIFIFLCGPWFRNVLEVIFFQHFSMFPLFIFVIWTFMFKFRIQVLPLTYTVMGAKIITKATACACTLEYQFAA
jgi:hypothetical protein